MPIWARQCQTNLEKHPRGGSKIPLSGSLVIPRGWILESFRLILMCFLGGLGVLLGLRFQTWRGPGPSQIRKNCEEGGFRDTTDACLSFVRSTSSSEGCICSENIINNRVSQGGHYRQFGAKVAPKRRLGRPFWCPGAVQKATLAAKEGFGRWFGASSKKDLMS